MIYNENPSNHRRQRLHSSTILDQLKEQNTIVYSYTLRPGICKDLHYGNDEYLEDIIGIPLNSRSNISVTDRRFTDSCRISQMCR